MIQEWLQVTNYQDSSLTHPQLIGEFLNKHRLITGSAPTHRRRITDFRRLVSDSSLISNNSSSIHHRLITNSSPTHHRRIMIIVFHRIIIDSSLTNHRRFTAFHQLIIDSLLIFTTSSPTYHRFITESSPTHHYAS